MKKKSSKAKAEARQVLKSCKPWETQIANMRGQLNNLQSVQIALQMKAGTQQVLRAQAMGVAELTRGVDIEKVGDAASSSHPQSPIGIVRSRLLA
jgi:hypothetical protein